MDSQEVNYRRYRTISYEDANVAEANKARNLEYQHDLQNQIEDNLKRKKQQKEREIREDQNLIWKVREENQSDWKKCEQSQVEWRMCDKQETSVTNNDNEEVNYHHHKIL